MSALLAQDTTSSSSSNDRVACKGAASVSAAARSLPATKHCLLEFENPGRQPEVLLSILALATPLLQASLPRSGLVQYLFRDVWLRAGQRRARNTMCDMIRCMNSDDLKMILARVQTWPKGAKAEAIKALREIEQDFIIGPATRYEFDRAHQEALLGKGVSLDDIKAAPRHVISMRVRFTETANDQLDRLPHRLQRRIVEKLEFYSLQPDPIEFSKPLTGSRECRFRIGAYRIFFEVLHGTMWVIAIRRRDAAYR